MWRTLQKKKQNVESWGSKPWQRICNLSRIYYLLSEFMNIYNFTKMVFKRYFLIKKLFLEYFYSAKYGIKTYKNYNFRINTVLPNNIFIT